MGKGDGNGMIKEITCKTLLSRVKGPDTWFGLTYNMNLYRGCEHQCIYCDSRSECYGIENFADTLVKVNAINLLRRELAGKRLVGTIGTGSMNDPYMPSERRFGLTGSALRVIAEFGFPVHIITKSDLVLKDLGTLKEISRVYAAVSFTITTADDDLARKLEPGAPPPSARAQSMTALAAAGIYTGVTMMPILPYLEDKEENIAQVVGLAYRSGAQYIIPAIGMTMRDRQRDYYYGKLDEFFPGLKERYQRSYGDRYQCAPLNAGRLSGFFHALCRERGIPTAITPFQPRPAKDQLKLF
jgi:DNA repair photolyase